MSNWLEVLNESGGSRDLEHACRQVTLGGRLTMRISGGHAVNNKAVAVGAGIKWKDDLMKTVGSGAVHRYPSGIPLVELPANGNLSAKGSRLAEADPIGGGEGAEWTGARGGLHARFKGILNQGLDALTAGTNALKDAFGEALNMKDHTLVDRFLTASNSLQHCLKPFVWLGRRGLGL